jgi:hypothetical protein
MKKSIAIVILMLMSIGITLGQNPNLSWVSTDTQGYVATIVFTSDSGGDLTLNDGYSTQVDTVVIGTNVIPLNPLSAGIYSDLFFTVTTSTGSAGLIIPNFEITGVPPNMHWISTDVQGYVATIIFTSDTGGDLTLNSGYSTQVNTVVIGTNVIPLDPLSAGTYSDLLFTVTASTGSSDLIIPNFEIVGVPPNMYWVSTTVNENVAIVTFHTDVGGDFSVSSGYSTLVDTAVLGTNIVGLDPLAPGTYSDLLFTVVTNEGISEDLIIPPFEIVEVIVTDTIPPQLTWINTIVAGNITTIYYHSSEAGTLGLSTGYSSSTNTTVIDQNILVLDPLPVGVYDDLTLSVTDTANNVGTLSIPSFEITEVIVNDTIAPSLTWVQTIVNGYVATVIYESSEAGTLSLSTGYSSQTNTTVLGQNILILDPLSVGIYNDLTLAVTDTANNVGTLLVPSFEIKDAIVNDTIPPYLKWVSTTVNGYVATIKYSSSEAGTLSLSSGYSSQMSTTVVGENILILNPLPVGVYSDLTLAVTDTANNVGLLLIPSFEIEEVIVSDTIPPHLTWISTTINGYVASIKYSSSEAGDLVLFSGYSSPIDTTIVGINTLVLDPLPAGTYSDCILAVKDTAGNIGNLLVPTFKITDPIVIDSIPPSLYWIRTDVEGHIATIFYSSSENGDLGLSSGYSAQIDTTFTGVNILMLDSLPAGVYSDFMITVTDTAQNSANLLIPEFIIEGISVDTVSFDWVHIKSSNRIDSTKAVQGNTIHLQLKASVTADSIFVDIAGRHSVTANPHSGYYESTILVQNDDPIGLVEFQIYFWKDGTEYVIDETTDNSFVEIDLTPADVNDLKFVTVYSNNNEARHKATVGSIVTLEIAVPEGMSTDSITIMDDNFFQMREYPSNIDPSVTIIEVQVQVTESDLENDFSFQFLLKGNDINSGFISGTSDDTFIEWIPLNWDFKVLPNAIPSGSNARISFNAPDNSKEILIELVAMNGKVVWSTIIDTPQAGYHSQPTSFGNIASGFYIWRLTASKFDGQPYTAPQKFIIQ